MKRLGYENTPFALTSFVLHATCQLHTILPSIRPYSSTNSPGTDIVPIKSYSNADTLKVAIIKENKSKSGVYRFVNTISGKSYVGSAINLSNRFHQYYSFKFMDAHLKSRNSAIYSALLKYGYSNFSLDILEYCEPDVISREQFYITLLCPEYNILKIAGSRVGSKHTEETKDKLRALQLNHKIS
jgi:hypothetical protein